MELYVKNIDGMWFGVAIEEQRVVATNFSNSRDKVTQNMMDRLAPNTLKPAVSVSSLAARVFTVMNDIYDGKAPDEVVPLSIERLPMYTQRVLSAVSHIPVGFISSYGAVAVAAGGGARAVGNVMASNPFAPIIPCHRVVTSNLGLGGYGGGLQVKLELLKREKRGYNEPRKVNVDGGILKIFPVEFMLKKLGVCYIEQ